MQVTQVKSEGLERVFAVTISKAALAERVDAKLEEIRHKVQIKGFRPGKVPVSHVRKLYGQSVTSEVVEETVQQTANEAIEKENLRPAAQPQIRLTADAQSVLAGTADLSFEIALDVMPTFATMDPRTLSVVKPVVDVDAKEVDEALEELAKNSRSYEAKKGKAKKDDAVVMNFEGKIDGVAFEGGKAEGAEIVIGSGRLIDTFEDQLIGLKAGEDKTVTVTFPAEYPVKELAGKQAEFAVTCIEVKAPQDVAVDDELAKRLGLSDLGKLREAVKTDKGRELSGLVRAVTKRRLFDLLDEGHVFDLPAKMVEAEFAGIWQRVEQDKAAGELAEEDKDKPEDQLRAEFRKIAERRVKLGLVLAEIGTQSQIDVTDEELRRGLAQEASRYPGQERQVIEFFRKNPQALMQIRAPIFEEKVVDYILELANVTTQSMSREELLAQAE